MRRENIARVTIPTEELPVSPQGRLMIEEAAFMEHSNYSLCVFNGFAIHRLIG